MTRIAHSQLALLASLAALIRADDAHTFEIVKKGAECKSPDRWLGPDGDPTHKVATVEECAAACAAAKDCRFFIYGSGGTKAGDCYVEFTKKRTCPEEFEEDEFDFYELKAAWIGCMEPRASNYNSAATIDDNSCTESDTCAHRRGDGTCPNCIAEGQCAAGTNDGYRNRDHDTVWASKVAKGSIQVDGDLSDWMNHMHGDRCYTDVAFARADGEEVIFEAYAGGSWYAAQFGAQFGAQFSERSSILRYGPGDFSTKWMTAWDDDYFYLAIDVTDDVMRVGRLCYEQGLQVAFEVGGPASKDGGTSMAGMLQAKRSSDLSISRLNLINLGLQEGQASCTTAPGATGRDCCVHYELNNGDGWLQLGSVAVLRNENSKHTFIEVAFSKLDLLGSAAAHTSRWGEGLTFGFSFLVNDGDETNTQQGWGGFYPHALVQGWNDGQKEPQKLGLVRLGGADAAPGGGGGAGAYFGGFFTAVALAVVGVVLKSRHANSAWPFNGQLLPGGFPRPGGGGGGGGGGMRGGLAAADSYSSYSVTAPPLTATGP